MVQKLKRLFGRVDLRLLSGLAVVVLAATLILAVATEKEEAVYFDKAEYDAIFAARVETIYDLEQWFVPQQYALLPIVPPVADFVLKGQPGEPGLIPFTAEKFPKEFVKGLVGLREYSVPVYPVTIAENPVTRAVEFYNLEGQLIHTLSPATGYDPFAYLKDKMPALYTARAHPDTRAYWERMLDPARVQITARLIEPDDVEHWLYAKAQVLAAQAELEGGGEMMMMLLQESTTTNIYFSKMAKVTNGLSMTIVYPSGFTNGLDIFMCSELVPEIWSFAAKDLPTGGTNLVWVDTNNWVQTGYPVRMYAAADATTDTDGDGYPDGRELMVYQTDPNAATSHPATVSGSVSYTGPETGKVYVVFATESESWSLAKSLTLTSPAAYVNSEIGNHQSYWIKAFRDVNGNLTRDAWEPWGAHAGNPLLVTGDVSGIDIAMQDVPSVWGTISYSGAATGDVYVVAITSSNSWDATHQTVLPWITSGGLTGEQYFASFPMNYSIAGMPVSNYWIRAFVDEDYNGVYTPGEPAGQHALNAIPVSNRVAGVGITLGLDSDGDGFTDFEEGFVSGMNPDDAQDGITALAIVRSKIRAHWTAINATAPTFSHPPGSQADLNELKEKLMTLATNFFVGGPAAP